MQEAQIEIDDLVKQRHQLEDRLEDDNGKLESLAQQAELAKQDVDEAAYQRKEAEEARRQVEEAMYRLQEQLDATRTQLARAERGGGGGGGGGGAMAVSGAGGGRRPALVGALVGLLLASGGGAGWLAWTGRLQLPGDLGGRIAALGSGTAEERKPADDDLALKILLGKGPAGEPKPTPATLPAGPAPPVAAAPAARRLKELHEGPAPALVLVSGGTYTMGNNNDPLSPDQRPEHQVRLGDFYVARYEVTFTDYDRFARATGRRLPDDNGWGRGERPVIDVTWDDARAYSAWLSHETGATYRLPSEAEWEYLAGAGSRSFYWWGYDLGRDKANCFNCGSRWDGVRTAPVGSFAANALGLYDTAGNVAEWVEDCYHANYEGAPTDGQAWQGRGTCEQRVLRGGAFNKPSANLQTTSRAAQRPSIRLPGIGFRVVRDAG